MAVVVRQGDSGGNNAWPKKGRQAWQHGWQRRHGRAGSSSPAASHSLTLKKERKGRAHGFLPQLTITFHNHPSWRQTGRQIWKMVEGMAMWHVTVTLCLPCLVSEMDVWVAYKSKNKAGAGRAGTNDKSACICFWVPLMSVSRSFIIVCVCINFGMVVCLCVCCV